MTAARSQQSPLGIIQRGLGAVSPCEGYPLHLVRAILCTLFASCEGYPLHLFQCNAHTLSASKRSSHVR